MDTKSLLIGLAGFILGGLVVSVAASQVQEPAANTMPDHASMMNMSDSLKGKTGDDFDKAFVAGMIEHHQGAIDMAKLATINAKHEEIKALSRDILSAQSKEIDQMQAWQSDWGYKTVPKSH